MVIKKHSNLKKVVMIMFIFIIGIGRVSAAGYQNYFGINMTNQEYNNLLNLGFTEEQIYYMNLTTFQENKDLSATIVDRDIKYLKTTYPAYGFNPVTVELTEEEFERESQINLLGTVETTYKTMVTTMSRNGNYFRYKVDLSWKNMPVVRSHDIMGIGYNDEVYIASSIYMNYYYCNSSGTCYTSSNYYDKLYTDFGGTTIFKLPESAVSLSSTMYFDVGKDTTDTITRLEFCGDYSHAVETVSGSQATNHSISRIGISLGSSINPKYDSITCAESGWSGTW